MRAITTYAGRVRNADGFYVAAVEELRSRLGFLPKDCARGSADRTRMPHRSRLSGKPRRLNGSWPAASSSRSPRARDDRERELFGKGRNNAFGALCRLSSFRRHLFCCRTRLSLAPRLPETLRFSRRQARKYDFAHRAIFFHSRRATATFTRLILLFR